MMKRKVRVIECKNFAIESGRRKRLGQYFTGVPLGRLLAALADAASSDSIIDPMAGTGDLLEACLAVGARPDAMAAIDIDQVALSVCKERLPKAACVLGNAFDTKTFNRITSRTWDLVITNPPYVRYQSYSEGGKENSLPNANDIRNKLLALLDNMTALDKTDKTLFKQLVVGYSGLSDLAVPSWILCAALLSPGGRLALVVPEPWLSRDYSAVVRYLLLRWFSIEYLVEDEHAAWFPGAQVKTTLMVARRIPRRKSAFAVGLNECYLKVRLSGHAAGSSGPVDRFYPGKANKEILFARDAASWCTSGFGFRNDLVEATQAPIADFAVNLRAVCSMQKWYSGMGERMRFSETSDVVLPRELSDWHAAGRGVRLAQLHDMGILIGQGLRTGANAFFYADASDSMGNDGLVELVWDKRPLRAVARVSVKRALVVLRRQAELPDGFLVKASTLRGRVLALRGMALPENIVAKDSVTPVLESMPEDLAAVVRRAMKMNFGTPDKPKLIQELSAVAPNIRCGDKKNGFASGFWYELPEFTQRHRPDILMARINNVGPKAYLNAEQAVLVDANFSTITTNKDSFYDAYALLSILNSSWSRAFLELSATVMGGGALKVEATHLRRMPVPAPDPGVNKRLGALGRALAKGNDISETLGKIDYELDTILLGRKPRPGEVEIIRKLAESCRKRREHQKRKVKT